MKKIILLITVLINLTFFAQEKRETRAVWVATNFHLDWPPQTYDGEIQKLELSNIFSDINNKKLNTIYFQVRSNGTVMFNSSFEPFSPYFTGATGIPPNYDPLKLAIKLAHKKGLELHAWVNVMRCFAGTEREILSSQMHIANKHPDWVIEYTKNGKTSLWLDPGLPAVREYLINLITEIVRNYEVDGIHLDFLRYPGKNFNDDFSYNLYGNGQNKGEWRRNNLTSFMADLFKSVREIKPYIKIGVTPFGIYKNLKNAEGTEGYSSVYQDSREWLRLGYIDYAVPQIYWNINDNPKFDILARDWTTNSFNRNIVLGIAAYKADVKSELSKLIKFSRSIHASGIAFFRYGNIKNYNFKEFQNRSYPSTLPWLEKKKPLPPTNLSAFLSPAYPNRIILKWHLPLVESNYDSVKYYALYKLEKPNDSLSTKNLYDIFEADKTSIALSIYTPGQLKYYFALKSVDKTWNESKAGSNVVAVSLPSLSPITKQLKYFDNPILVKNIVGTYNLLMYSNQEDSVIVSAIEEGSPVKINSARILPGKNIFSLNADLAKYSSIVIKYIKQNKEVNLKF